MAFGSVTGITNIDQIRDDIFVPINLSLILSLAILPSIFLGYVSRRLFRKGISEGDCWAKCFAAITKCGSYALVYTTDGKEYKGIVCIAGIGENSPKEVVLNEPKIILRDENFKVLSEVANGKVMLFNENNISRIAFLNDISP